MHTIDGTPRARSARRASSKTASSRSARAGATWNHTAPGRKPIASEPMAAGQEPMQHQLDGVTESADWGWDDPEDFSAPV